MHNFPSLIHVIDVVTTTEPQAHDSTSQSNDSLPKSDGMEFDSSGSRNEILQEIDNIVASLITSGNAILHRY